MQQRVDVAAGQHGDHRRPEQAAGPESSSAATAAAPAGSTTSLARSSRKSRARDSISSLTVTSSSTSSRHDRERHVARAARPRCRRPSWPSRSSGTGSPGRQRGRVGRGLLGLHADHPHVGPHGLAPRSRCPASSPPPPVPTTIVRDVRALLEDLQADRALPGDDVGVVERVDQDRPGLARRTRAPRPGSRRWCGPSCSTCAPYAPGGHELGHAARPCGMKTVEPGCRAAARRARRPGRGCRRWRRRRRAAFSSSESRAIRV